MIKVDIELFNLKINLLKREKLLILLNLTNLKQHSEVLHPKGRFKSKYSDH